MAIEHISKDSLLVHAKDDVHVLQLDFLGTKGFHVDNRLYVDLIASSFSQAIGRISQGELVYDNVARAFSAGLVDG